MLADYSTWPELAQVFKLESQRTNALGITKTEVRYGVTSLPASLADAKRVLALSRRHWGIGAIRSAEMSEKLSDGEQGGEKLLDN